METGTNQIHDLATIGDLHVQNAVSTQADLAKMTGKQLVDFWNALPGVTQVKKFTNTAVAMTRIWKQMNPTLAVSKPEGKKAKSKKAAKPAKKAAAKGERAERTDTFKHVLLEKMRRVKGITLEDVLALTKEMGKTGKPWKTPSVHGYVSNLVKKGFKIKSFKPDNGVRTYIIEG